MTKVVFAAMAFVTVVGCTFGGSHEDPQMGTDSDPVSFDGSLASDPRASASASSSAASPSSSATKAPSVSDGGSKLSTPSADASRPRVDANSLANGCAPSAPIDTCDPVRNTGCPPLMQCDIDTGATKATGRCVFQAEADASVADSCSATFVSETCAAQSTCVSNQCRKMCYCDGDCPRGQCCNDASGPGPAGAFKLCSPC